MKNLLLTVSILFSTIIGYTQSSKDAQDFYDQRGLKVEGTLTMINPAIKAYEAVYGPQASLTDQCHNLNQRAYLNFFTAEQLIFFPKVYPVKAIDLYYKTIELAEKCLNQFEKIYGKLLLLENPLDADLNLKLEGAKEFIRSFYFVNAAVFKILEIDGTFNDEKLGGLEKLSLWENRLKYFLFKDSGKTKRKFVKNGNVTATFDYDKWTDQFKLWSKELKNVENGGLFLLYINGEKNLPLIARPFAKFPFTGKNTLLGMFIALKRNQGIWKEGVKNEKRISSFVSHSIHEAEFILEYQSKDKAVACGILEAISNTSDKEFLDNYPDIYWENVFNRYKAQKLLKTSQCVN
jgi:hypothetical protein